MKCFYSILFAFLILFPAAAQDVGSGAPNDGIAAQFVNAFYRNRFNTLVSLPPVGNVRSFGSTGYVQEFNGVASSGKYALVKPKTTTLDVFQVYPAIYALYGTAGVTNAGYPNMDTGYCGGTQAANCTYQLFDKNYVLFAFADSGAAFATRDPFFTKWNSFGGVSFFGPATTAEQTITTAAANATGQQFLNGAIYSITSGAYSGKVFAVGPKLYPTYQNFGLHSGGLGLPTSDELQIGTNTFRQNFQGGALEYTKDGSDPVLRPLVGGVGLSIATTDILRLSLGDTRTIQAVVTSTTGTTLTDRNVSWATSNGRVVSIQTNGNSATLKAVGGGTALVTASSEGKVSPTLTIFVSAPCCQIGEGAPTPAIAQSFADAVTRNRLSIRIPVATPVRRIGQGYVQELQGTDANSTRYLLARSDSFPGVFVITGDILKAYDALGGPPGTLGFPTSDPTATGRQNFENGALAGNPVQLVNGFILSRWSTLGFEAGTLGPPVAAVSSNLTFTGTSGSLQLFRDGAIASIDSGPRRGRTYLVRGLILSAYNDLNGPAGKLGLPLTEQSFDGAIQSQDFEGGTVQFAPGASQADVLDKDRVPDIQVFPSTVTAGGVVRVAIGGFADSATLKVAFTGPSAPLGFTVGTTSGSYTWEIRLPSTAASGTIQVRASDAAGPSTASAFFTVKSLADARITMTKTRGDTQSGLPGSILAAPLVITLRDDQSTPLVGIPVTFTASPGAQVVTATAATDANGQAQATLRLPSSEGVALMTADAVKQIVTFSAKVAAANLSNFPRQQATGSTTIGSSAVTIAQKGSLLAAASSVIRFYQNRGDLPSSLGFSDPVLLNAFLSKYCTVDASGAPLCDGYLTPAGQQDPIVNLWRLAAFTGNNLAALPTPLLINADGSPDLTPIRDALAQGTPPILAINLAANGQPAGTHFVVALGISSDGAVAIHDPSPVFNRPLLGDYGFGFTAAGKRWTGTLSGVIRLLPQAPSSSGFLVLVSANAPSGSAPSGPLLDVQSPAGPCGVSLGLPGLAPTDGLAPVTPASIQLRFCDGAQPLQQLDLTSDQPFTGSFTDFGNPGRVVDLSAASGSSYRLTRTTALWDLAPADVSFDASNVLNAANPSSPIAPGSLISVSGSGLAKAGGTTTVEVGGVNAQIVSATGFGVTFVLPQDTAPGAANVRITSPYGFLDQTIAVVPVAPTIFVTGGAPVITNADGTRNSPFNPALRGRTVTIYATGLGVVNRQGNNLVPATPVTVVIQGVGVSPSAITAPANLPGVNGITVTVPTDLPPALNASVALRQGGIDSYSLVLALQ